MTIYAAYFSHRETFFLRIVGLSGKVVTSSTHEDLTLFVGFIRHQPKV